jgi:hypothetical protein
MAAADDDDATLVENPSALVFGIMGSGVFAIIFMVFLTFVVCVLSVPCRAIEKTVARVVIIVLTAIVVLILIFADKESKFSSTSLSDKVSPKVQSNVLDSIPMLALLSFPLMFLTAAL